jgi:DNA-binding CsgD family transcriptional regulator
MTSAVDAAGCERAAIRAYLLGADDECAKHWEAAHRAALDAGNPAESARYAFWLGLILMLRGQTARAGGWFMRAEDLIAQAGTECPASGYVLIPRALAALNGGDPAGARDTAVRATEIGVRCGDADLRAFGALAHGQALIAMGEPAAGVMRLDDVMVSVTADELSPITTGIVYCAVILECMDLFDLGRASEWTSALGAWCDSRPDMVPFRGQCLVHRSQLQQAVGDWSAAVASALSACARLADPPHPALGLAYYQKGELGRLLGDFEEAEHDYLLAARHGHDPMPGLALLQLARGSVDAAVVAIQRVLHERSGLAPRPVVLAAAVEIFRAAGDFASAREASDELAAIAEKSTSTALKATATQAAGAVQLCAGDVSAALAELRTAARIWQSLRMPYDAARVSVLLGLACAALGDRTSAEMQFGSAKDIFAELGAVPDVEHVSMLSTGLGRGSTATGVLSDREQQVLTLLAAGRSNREIAEELVVSPHTVARHVEHIYAKFGVSNRTAATRYAYEHHLV